MGKRIFLAATGAMLLASAGCTRYWCEHHGYYPGPPPAAYTPQCCVPCVPCSPAPAAGYVAPAPAPSWNAPASVPANTCPAGCVPAPHY